MCQTLFFIPGQLAGYPVFGAGLLLAVWAVASIAVLTWSTWRHGLNADTALHAVIAGWQQRL